MKIIKLFAAASIALASLGVSVAADAQPQHRDGRSDHGKRNDRGGYNRHDNGNHYGQRKHRQTCRVVYRHGHRQRVCR